MVFIAGPTASGKTVFGIGLYKYIAGDAKLENDTIYIGSNDFPPAIDELYYYMLEHGYPIATKPDELRVYGFKVDPSILGGEQTFIEFADYAGEHLEKLPKVMKKYDEVVNEISKSIGSSKEEEEILHRIKVRKLTFNDIKKLSGIIPKAEKSLLDSIIYAYLISQLNIQTKLILLIDGEKILRYFKGEDTRIVYDLIIYKRLIIGDKNVCLVTTKADLLDEIFEEETGKTRVENKKKFIKWIDKKLKVESPYRELRKDVSKIFATSVRPIKYGREHGVNIWGFEDIKKWIESVSLLGDRLL